MNGFIICEAEGQTEQAQVLYLGSSGFRVGNLADAISGSAKGSDKQKRYNNQDNLPSFHLSTGFHGFHPVRFSCWSASTAKLKS